MNIIETILTVVRQVRADNAFCDQQLKNTGPGESPWSNESSIRMEAAEKECRQLLMEHLDLVESAFDCLAKKPLVSESGCPVMTPPWTSVNHNWSDTSLYKDGRHICTLSIADEATEETQEALEKRQADDVQFMLSALNGSEVPGQPNQ